MEDAVLSSRWKEINSARTDADGKFEIDDLMASQTEQSSRIPRHVVKLEGRYGSEICIQQPSLLVEHPDFAARQVYVDTMPGNVDVQLELPAILEGRVVFHGTGKPVANARIQATTVIDISPRANSFVAKSYDVSTTTDDGGNYRLEHCRQAGTNYGQTSRTGPPRESAQSKQLPTRQLAFRILKVAKGGIVRLRLVEKKSGKPISLEENAKVCSARFRSFWAAAFMRTCTIRMPSPREERSFACVPGRMISFCGRFSTVRAIHGHGSVATNS